MAEFTGKQFLSISRIPQLTPSEQSRGLPQPPIEDDIPAGEVIPLPKPEEIQLGHCDLRAAIENRRSVRQYGAVPLSLEELSFALWCTQGVKRVTRLPGTLRTVPSAGGRHAFETILLVNRVEGLAPDLYRFLAVQHALVKLGKGETIAAEVVQACRNQEFIAASAVTFIWTAVLARMRFRYGERGYRYLFLDAGHVCQNLYLAAEAIDCGVCAIAAYDDDALNALLGLDGDERFAIYVGTLGKRLPRPEA